MKRFCIVFLLYTSSLLPGGALSRLIHGTQETGGSKSFGATFRNKRVLIKCEYKKPHKKPAVLTVRCKPLYAHIPEYQMVWTDDQVVWLADMLASVERQLTIVSEVEEYDLLCVLRYHLSK